MTTTTMTTAGSSAVADAMPLKLEAVRIPVADPDRAKQFYASLGWRQDADFDLSEDFRILQFTPPESEASILFGRGVTSAEPGAIDGLQMAVRDIDAARDELIARGVDVSEIWHLDAAGHRVPGAAPDHADYGSYASFSDPDGNGWLIQEIRQRAPGRGIGMDVPNLTLLLREAEEHHGPYEASAPPHHWSGFYAAYVYARLHGRTPDEADGDARRHMERVLASGEQS
jgi:catechol 2,3-dioxygenase-like lactoylglutathione lyase family enzyme